MPAGIRPNLPPTFLVPSSNLPPTFLVPSSYLPPTFLLPSLYLPPTLPVSCSLYPAGGCCARWDTSLGGLPALACVQLAVSRWGVVCTLGHVPTLPVPSSYLTCVLLAVSRWGVVCTLGHVPTLPVPSSYLTCVLLAVSRWGVLCTLGYIPRRPSRPCLRPGSSIPLGVCSARCVRPLEAFPPSSTSR